MYIRFHITDSRLKLAALCLELGPEEKLLFLLASLLSQVWFPHGWCLSVLLAPFFVYFCISNESKRVHWSVVSSTDYSLGEFLLSLSKAHLAY